MTEIKFTVPAVPVSQPRPHAVGRMVGGKVTSRVHEVTSIKNADGSRKPHPISAYKATVRHAAALAHSSEPLTGPLGVTLTFVMPRPQSLVWKAKPMVRLPHVVKPDCDNLIKSTLDALKGLTWRDDTQIFTLHASKWIAGGDEQPHVVVEIEEYQ